MSDPQPELDVLIASTMYLMSRFGKKKNVGLIEAIQMHLQLIQGHPDLNSEVLNKVCKQLEIYWSSINDSVDSDKNNSSRSLSSEQAIFNIH